MRYGPWKLFDGDNYLELTDYDGDDNGGISLMGLPGRLRTVMITSRPRITSIAGIALRDQSNNVKLGDSWVEHVFVFRDDGTPESLSRSIDVFLGAIVPSGMPRESINEYRKFIQDEINRESVLRDKARAIIRKEIQARTEERTPLRIGLGEVRSGTSTNDSWIETSIHTLDVTDIFDFDELFASGSVTSFRAEHVLEHLTLAEAYVAMTHVVKYLKPGGRIRIAVPDYDGMRARLDGAVDKEEYLMRKDLEEGHKVRYSRESLSILLATAGFHRVEVLEYYTREGQLVSQQGWGDDDGGHIRRSSHGKEPISLVMDAYTHPEIIREV